MSKTKTPIQNTAKAIRDELPVEKQPELFRVAVEAGYLAALADGDADPRMDGPMADPEAEHESTVTDLVYVRGRHCEIVGLAEVDRKDRGAEPDCVCSLRY